MSGVGLTGLIKPLNGGSFPVFEDIDGLGGFRVVLDTTARDAIPQNYRKAGMVVTTSVDNNQYQLQGGTLDANWAQLNFGAQGSQGAQGPGGGAQGAQGAQGRQGAQGTQGAGFQGAQGNPGVDGAQGQQGFQGGGFQGFQGFQGAQGSQGFQGFQGAQAGAFQLNPTSIANLEAINTTSLVSGTLADAGTVGDLYRLNKSPTAGETAGIDATNIVPATTVSGNVWERLGIKNLAFAFVAAWFIDASAGNDANDGLTSGTALKTIEELCRRLCPGGQVCTPFQTTTVTVAAGSYGALSLDIAWPAGTSFRFIIACAFTSGAAITLSSVTNTNSATLTRGELVTASGTFIAKRRIRSTSGANVGAITYSTGLNGVATDTFVGSWLNTTTLALVTIANGTTVTVDTLTVSFASVDLRVGLAGSIEVHDAMVSVVTANQDNVNLAQAILFVGCELAGYFSGTYVAYACRTTNFVAHSGGTAQYIGTVLQQRIDVGLAGLFRSSGGSTWDAAPIVVDVTGSALVEGDSEWENGAGISAAIAVNAGAVIEIISKVWGASSNYTRGVSIESGGLAITSSAALLAIPATTQVTLGGGAVSLAYNQLPASLPASDSAFVVNPAPSSSKALFGNVSTPFNATYYVDPAFVGISNGSESNPFTSITAAFAAGATAGLTVGLVFLAPGANTTETVTFPTGGNWEIACQTQQGATITGNVVCTSVSQQFRILTNLTVTGTVTGQATSSVGNILILNRSTIAGAVTLTGTGSGFWFLVPAGPATSFFGISGSFSSTVTVTGQLLANNYFFGGAISFSSVSILTGCTFNTTSISITGSGSLELLYCNPNTSLTITGTGTSHVSIDAVTMNQLLIGGFTPSGVIQTVLDGALKLAGSFAGNVTSTPVASTAPPAGMYRADVRMVATAAGTLGTASFNLTATDAAGSFTVSVASMNIATDARAQGSYNFQSTGAANVSFSITGITTAGALAAQYELVLTRID